MVKNAEKGLEAVVDLKTKISSALEQAGDFSKDYLDHAPVIKLKIKLRAYSV